MQSVSTTFGQPAAEAVKMRWRLLILGLIGIAAAPTAMRDFRNGADAMCIFYATGAKLLKGRHEVSPI